MEIPSPQPEHLWLQKLVGEWTVESECSLGPDQPPLKTYGQEVVRSVGKLWILGEGTGGMPDGDVSESLITLGYDPQTQQFVGTFIASVMTHLWPYRGQLDAAGNKLALNSVGPSFMDQTKTANYIDTIEIISDDYRTLSSQVETEDGSWHPFMIAHYRRK